MLQLTKQERAIVSRLAQERIEGGEEPSSLVHFLTDARGEVWDLSSGLTVAEYQGGGYIESYYTLAELASL